MVGGGSTYLPPLPARPQESEYGGASAAVRRGIPGEGGRKKHSSTQQGPSGITWSSIARMVNKKESQRHKAAVKSLSTTLLPRAVGVSNGSSERSSLRHEPNEHHSSSTPVLPQLVDPVDSFCEVLAANLPLLSEELSEVLPSEMELPMVEEEDPEDTEPSHILTVAPWKKNANRPPMKKLVRQCAMTFQTLDSMELDLTEDGENVMLGVANIPLEPIPRATSSSSRSSSDFEFQVEERDSVDSGAFHEKQWRKLKNVAHAAHIARHPSHDVGCDAGTMLDTMQLWRKYCRKTDHSFSTDSGRRSRWKGTETEAHAKSIRDLDSELQLDRDRLRLMIQQGVHKTKNGLKLTVRHVQPDIDRETLFRHRWEMLEKVDTKGKRIQQALNDSVRARKDLQTCVEALRDTMSGNVDSGRRKMKRKDESSRIDWTDRIDAIRKKLEEFILAA